jgi:hypothetical protein
LAASTDPRITNREAWRVGLAGLADAYTPVNSVLPDHKVHALIDAARVVDPALGLLVEVAAVTGSRVSQLKRIEVGGLRDDTVLMVPASRKGRNKRAGQTPVPIPTSLLTKLKLAAGDRPADAMLLVRSNGTPWRRGDHAKPFAAVAAKVGIRATVGYLRHSAIVRALLAGVPIKIVASNCDTSTKMIEKVYAKFITDFSDEISRKGMLDPAVRS